MNALNLEPNIRLDLFCEIMNNIFLYRGKILHTVRDALSEVRKVIQRLWYYLLHQEWGSCIPAERDAAGREWYPSDPLGSSRTARGSSSQTVACGSTWGTDNIMVSTITLSKELYLFTNIKKMENTDDAWGHYRVPAVTMVESPILVARSASRLMYLSPVRACGGRRACSSNKFPSPPSSMTYSIPKWACRDPTLSRNQLTASGLVMFSFTQNIPCHWLITGIWRTEVISYYNHFVFW